MWGFGVLRTPLLLRGKTRVRSLESLQMSSRACRVCAALDVLSVMVRPWLVLMRESSRSTTVPLEPSVLRWAAPIVRQMAS